MSNDYMPTRDSEVVNWMNVFMGYANANLAALGMVAADATALQTQATAMTTALQASNTAQQSARSAVANKDTVRKTAETAFRNQVRAILARTQTTDAQRQGLGLNGKDRNPTAASLTPQAMAAMTRPKVSVDTSQRLQHVLKLEDSDEASRRRRPADVLRCEIFSRATADGAFQYLDSATTLTHVIRYEVAQANTTVQYQCRWVYKGSVKGPWSEVVSATIVG